MALHISISAETLFYIGPIPITNSFLPVPWSLSSSSSLLINSITLQKSLNKPTGLQNFFEMLVETFQNLGNSITQNDLKTSVIMPIPLAAFMWILLNNWFGLIPGVGTLGINQTSPPESSQETAFSPKAVFASEPAESREPSESVTSESEAGESEATAAEPETHTVKFVPIFRPGTADLNTTLALALIAVGATQVVGVKYLGKSYWSKFFNLKGIFAFVGILELVSEISKIISFAFRLFGNIFAGEVLLTVISFLALSMFKVIIPVVIPLPFYFLELFVGVIQALVFAMLTLVFMNMATIHGESEH